LTSSIIKLSLSVS